MKQSIVWANIPSCGLGNKLLVWARAAWFARYHDLPLVVSGWNNSIGIRTWLSGGGIRRYASDFAQSRIQDRISVRLAHLMHEVIDEPELEQSPLPRTLFRFSSVPHWSDYFGYFKQGRSFIADSLWKTLTDQCRAEIESCPPVEIAVHIRHGDFRTLKPGEEFAKVGQVRTSTEYFVNLIKNIRRITGGDRPSVTIFSDGRDADLAQVLSLANVRRAESKRAIVDIYRMARSKLLICAAGSTFSYWSAFLGNQPAVLHRDHIHQSIRPTVDQNTTFEGGLSDSTNEWPDLFKSNLSSIEW